MEIGCGKHNGAAVERRGVVGSATGGDERREVGIVLWGGVCCSLRRGWEEGGEAPLRGVVLHCWSASFFRSFSFVFALALSAPGERGEDSRVPPVRVMVVCVVWFGFWFSSFFGTREESVKDVFRTGTACAVDPRPTSSRFVRGVVVGRLFSFSFFAASWCNSTVCTGRGGEEGSPLPFRFEAWWRDDDNDDEGEVATSTFSLETLGWRSEGQLEGDAAEQGRDGWDIDACLALFLGSSCPSPKAEREEADRRIFFVVSVGSVEVEAERTMYGP